jgi:hypothetical protein
MTQNEPAIVPHVHDGDEDIPFIHASWSTSRLAAHVRTQHGVPHAQAMTRETLRLGHAERHTAALSPEAAQQVTDGQLRSYAAKLLRRLAERAPTEVDHATLPLDDGRGSTEITTLDEIVTWLQGVAIRVENGVDF